MKKFLIGINIITLIILFILAIQMVQIKNDIKDIKKMNSAQTEVLSEFTKRIYEK